MAIKASDRTIDLRPAATLQRQPVTTRRRPLLRSVPDKNPTGYDLKGVCPGERHRLREHLLKKRLEGSE
jgi:hypothetical protein